MEQRAAAIRFIIRESASSPVPQRLTRGLGALLLGLLPGGFGSIALPLAATFSLGVGAASAETVVERAARTGQITIVGPNNAIPYSFRDRNNNLTGIAPDLSKAISAEVGAYLNRTIGATFVVENDHTALFREVALGLADIACGVPFTWEREMFVDYSLPFALSGIRLLTSGSAIDGSAASLAGKRVGAVKDSLGSTVLNGLGSTAVVSTYPSLDAAAAALKAGQLDAVIGDSIGLAGLRTRKEIGDGRLVPELPYVRYGVGCIMPQNNSTFRNLVNLTIAQVLQAYINGETEAVAMVNGWVGPGSALDLQPEAIRGFFETVLLTTEQIRTPRTRAAN